MNGPTRGRRGAAVRGSTAPPRAQRGLSLVELMISTVLGLVVVAAVYNTWMGTTRSARFTEGLQRMQENGRHGVATLQRGLRLAGYSPDGDLPGTRPPIDLAASGNDHIVVRMRQKFDCNGVSTLDRGGVAVDTYAYDEDARAITCVGDSDGAAAMPLVEGVGGFRLLYGLDEAGDDDVPERYVPHGSVTDARRVAAIRFALLIASDEPVRRADRQENHVLLDLVKPTEDRYARTVFTSTVKLRNRRSGG